MQDKYKRHLDYRLKFTITISKSIIASINQTFNLTLL
jgi:hypothetical protein